MAKTISRGWTKGASEDVADTDDVDNCIHTRHPLRLHSFLGGTERSENLWRLTTKIRTELVEATASPAERESIGGRWSSSEADRQLTKGRRMQHVLLPHLEAFEVAKSSELGEVALMQKTRFSTRQA